MSFHMYSGFLGDFWGFSQVFQGVFESYGGEGALKGTAAGATITEGNSGGAGPEKEGYEGEEGRKEGRITPNTSPYG